MNKTRKWLIGVVLVSIALAIFFQFKDLPGNMGALLTVKELVNKHNKELNELVDEGAENHTNVQFVEGKYYIDVNKNVITSEGKNRVNHYEYVLVYEDLEWKVIKERFTYSNK